ncbi:Or10a [Drosophila busckii]|uniref:Odorant receptor n=1 Tax=Drosophila busckii TaxID=30019 RepID=A0A0M4EVT1_DROBS|nr:Or10a [Drosophila busckii]
MPAALCDFRFLRSNQPLSLYFFAVPRLCLDLLGCWPREGGKIPWRALFHFLVLGIGVATELHAGFVFAQNKQLDMALETFCPAGTSAVTLLKMCLMHYYRHDLCYVLKQLKLLLYRRQDQTMEKRLILHQHSVMAARINFWPLSAGFATASTYNLMPLLLPLLLYLQGSQQDIVWNMPFNMTMPQFLLGAPFFPLTYVFSGYTAYTTIFMFAGCDGFYFEYCVHMATLFQSMECDLRAYFKPYQRQVATLASDGEFEKFMVALVRRHNVILRLTHFFRQRYMIITMAHFMSASLVIGFSIFDLLTMGGNDLLNMLLYMVYTVAALSQLFIYCYGGTLVAESSSHLATAMGMCPWQLCTPRQRVYVRLFMMRSQRALTMTVPFFCPSLATFAAVSALSFP